MMTFPSGRRTGLPALLAVVALMLFIGACGDQKVDAGPEPSASTSEMSEIRLSVSGDDSAAIEDATKVVRARLSALGLKGSEVSVDGTRITVQVGAEDAPLVRELLKPPGRLEFRPVLQAVGQIPTGKGQLTTELTSPDQMKSDEEVTLATEDGMVYRLGPVAVDGRAVKNANAGLSQDGKWTVNPVFRSGKENIGRFNDIAAKCFNMDAECRDIGSGRGQLAIVLDGVILTAPTINTPSFGADEIQISGGFDEKQARTVSAVLAGGAAPASWTLES